MAKTETETRSGRCADHGQVTATRELPTLRFPYLYWSIVRARAKRGPFVCPTCGAPASTG
jgi:hypothetical protein